MDERQTRFSSEMWRDMDSGWVMISDLIAATGVLMGLGWLIDRWLATGPWLMLAGALVGFSLGTYLVYLRAKAQGEAEQARRQRL